MSLIKKQMNNTYEHCAGAVLYCFKEYTPFYFLVVQTDGNCGLPKGHTEPGESIKDTAIREIFEETGIDAAIDEGFEETIKYPLPNGNIKITTYFLANAGSDKYCFDPTEILEVKLLPYESALSEITYDNIKEVLKKAHIYLMNSLNADI